MRTGRCGVHKARMDFWQPDGGAEHGQRQRFVILSLVLGQQGQGANHPVLVRDGVEEPRCRCRAGQRFDVAAVPAPGGRPQGQAPQALQRKGRVWQHAFGDAVAVFARQVVTQHHRLPLQGPRKKRVIVQRWCQAFQLLPEGRLTAQRSLRQLLQRREARAFIGLCKQHVKPHHRYLLALKQFVHQRGHLVPAPGPLADTPEALFIDIDDDDPLIQRAGHGHPQAGVVDDVVQPFQHLQVEHIGHMQQRKHQRYQRDRNAPPALAKQMRQGLQHVSARRKEEGVRSARARGDGASPLPDVSFARTASRCPPVPGGHRA